MSTLALKEKSVSRYVPYKHHVTDQIIACNDHEYMAVIKVSGRSADAADLAEQDEWIKASHNVLRGLPLGKLGLYSHTVHREVSEYPESKFPQKFATEFDQQYRATFQRDSLMINELYLTLLVHPVEDPILGAVASLEKADAKRIAAWQKESIEDLDSAVRAITAGLKRYDVEVLRIVDRNGYAFSEPAEFLAFLLTGQRMQIPVTRGYLNESIALARPVFAKYGPLGELRSMEGNRLFGMLEFTDLPKEVKPGHLDALMSVKAEFVLSQSWGSFTSGNAKVLTKRHGRLLRDSNDDSPGQLKQLAQLVEDLNSGEIGLGDHHATLLVYGEDQEKLVRSMANIRALLAEQGIIAKDLEKGLEAGFWAQLPANWSWRTRPIPITSYNFLCLSSFHNQLTGKATGNPWGPAVSMFKTKTGSPYFFNYHVSLDEVDETGKRRAGNTMIIGQTGTGKTVLQGVLLTQAQKFGATAVVYDKDEGMHVLILALGGRYFTLRYGESTGWQPLQMEPTERNVAFMKRWVASLAEHRGEKLNTTQSREISTAIDQLTQHIDLHNRNLSTLNTLLPNPMGASTISVHERLIPWCRGGEYGWVFDNDEDRLNLNASQGHNPIFGFDLTELLDTDTVRSAATLYLKHRIDELHDGRRIINLTDECQHPLKDEHFQKSMQDDARTIRKKNGVMSLSTQEPEAIAENPVGPSLIQQSATLIFLPNPKATEETYINKFKLTKAEFKLVKELGEFSRQFVIKQGSNVAVAEMNLSDCQDALLVFSGSSDMAQIAKQAIAEVGDDPDDWLPIYLSKARSLIQPELQEESL